ncbi:uncharacterized protein [Apostichopus japonicus]|uniref:uncharacterized protein n=1 Tax=Stichopus japonicus TaxID=307972 RepID=UPI003AB7B315
MSVQRGNYKKKGQKYKNSSKFKNNLHDNSKRTQEINSMVISEVCKRCMQIIQWKIQYKKYKQLTQPKKCTKCLQKTVKKAYYVICSKCAKDNRTCAKCGEKAEIIHENTPTASEAAAQQSALEAELRYMTERERRAYYRNQRKVKVDEEGPDSCDGNDDLEEDGDNDSSSTEDGIIEEEFEEDLKTDLQNLTLSGQSEKTGDDDASPSDVLR